MVVAEISRMSAPDNACVKYIVRPIQPRNQHHTDAVSLRCSKGFQKEMAAEQNERRGSVVMLLLVTLRWSAGFSVSLTKVDETDGETNPRTNARQRERAVRYVVVVVFDGYEDGRD